MAENIRQSRIFFKKYWTVFAGFFIVQILFDQIRTSSFYITGTTGYINWPSSILNSIADYTLWALVLVFLYRAYLRISPISGRKSWLQLIVVACIAGLTQALIQQFISLTFFDLLGRFDKPYLEVISESMIFFLPSAFRGILVVFMLFTLIAALDFYDRFRDEQLVAAELRSELSKSQLEILQAQLNPHFLFNALNTISMMVRNKKERKAISMISSLGDLLRTSLQMEATQMITLKEELNVVTQYLEIERERFNDRLQINVKIDREVELCGVPNMILQPILENAFKYGVSENLDNALIDIRAKSVEEMLRIEVRNNGNLLSENWEMNSNKGIGLNNVEKRLSHLFSDYSFDLSNDEKEGLVVATIDIPKIQLEQNAN